MSNRESNEERTTMNLIATNACAAMLLRLRAIRLALALACALGAWLALAAVPAAAEVIHNSEGSFTASETPAKSSSGFGYLLAIAVDNSTGSSAGDVYVGGFGSSGRYVYKFTAAGTYTGVELKGSETPHGSFSFLDLANYEFSRGLAVDESSGANKGDVYVADAEHDVVDRFSEGGKFLCEITGKAPTAGNTVEEKEFEKYECAGVSGSKTPQDGFHVGEYSLTALGAAVDPQNGDVYISSPADKAVDEFNEKGEYIGQITEHVTTPGSLVFNSTGELYVTNGSLLGGETVAKFDSKGVFVSVLDEKRPQYVSVNTSNGRVYVADGNESQTAEYDSSGKLISTFGKEQSGAVAVNGSTGRIYVSSLSDNTVYMYGKAVVIPNVTTGQSSEVTEQGATLHGEAEPDVANGGSNVESCGFEYASMQTLDHIQTVSLAEKFGFKIFTFSLSLERRGGQATGWEGDGTVSSESTVVTGVMNRSNVPTPGEEISGTGIKPGTTIVYYASAEHKIALSQATEAVTPAQEQERGRMSAALPWDASAKAVQHALEALRTVGADNVTVTGPAGGPWTVEFTGALTKATVPLLRAEASLYASTDVEPNWAAASKAACEPPTPYSGPTSVSAKVSGLTPSQTYSYRALASDSEGSAHGEYGHFTTPGPPSIDRIAAEARQTSVTFWTKINPFGSDTTCHVQYVTDAGFEESRWANAATVPCEAGRLGSGTDDLGSAIDGTEFPYAQDAVAIGQGGEHGDLARGTGYHYRFVAENKSGTSVREGSFETWGIKKLSVQMLEGSREFEPGRLGLWEPGVLESPPRAGAHPYEMVTTIDFTLTDEIHRCESSYSCEGGSYGEAIVQSGETMTDVKDVKVQLPPGLIGNPDNVPKCNQHVAAEGGCSPESQVGVLEYITDYPLSQIDGFVKPSTEEYEAGGCTSYCRVSIFNLEPKHANPAEFGNPHDVSELSLPFEVRAGADYGISNDTVDITAAAPVSQLRIRIWGVPGNAGHEVGRGSPASSEAPLLRNPTSCAGPQLVKAAFDTWSEPGVYTSKTAEMPAVAGCDKLKFEPSIEAQPTSTAADSASGMNFDLKVPQDEKPNELSTADLKDATITFPAGMTVDPSSADGRATCSEQQVGFTGFTELNPRFEPKVQTAQFTPGPEQCPDASKLATVEINTRLITHPIKGAMYLATPHSNPFGSLIAVYLTAYDPTTGVVVKLPGKVSLDQVTGQLTTTFEQNPQLPFEELKVNLFGGTRGAFTTPLTCGSYALATDLTPWSAPEGKDATPSSEPFKSFAGCVSSEAQAPNTPGFEAGTASPVAGSFSPFVLYLKREDGSQRFSGLNVTLPPGLTGKIAGLQQCPQAAIEAAMARDHEGEGAVELAHPSCPSGSEVGVAHVGAGSGAPYFVTGHVYFAGSYKGAPFSLVFITPAVAGPFDLGTVVVRAALYIDPSTAQVTVKSDPFPTILDGIPLDIRDVDVDMNRAQFTLNPTSCSVMSVTGQESSTTGQIAGLSDRFQAGGCTTLPFHPTFEASTSGVTSRKEGASLVVHITSGAGQANIGKVHVMLPKQLPSRLETLKGACPESVFAANPASCPAGSQVGTAVAHTPILSNPLTGPAYVVSHGGAELPDLEVVLQAEGVTIILDGKTNITNGITESTFGSVPDAPVSSFELTLPEGAHSILSAPGGNLCSLAMRTVLVNKKMTVKVKRHGHVQKRRVTRTVKETIAAGLLMPTMLQGQNGAVITQSTPISVTGCATTSVKHKTTKAHAKHKKHKTKNKTGKKRG